MKITQITPFIMWGGDAGGTDFSSTLWSAGAGRNWLFVKVQTDEGEEIAIWTGLAVCLRAEPLGLVLCLIAMAVSLLIPYIRARAESWGAEGKGGWMGRAERMILALVGIGLEGLGLPVLYPMLWIFVVLTALTVAQRIRKTWQQLPG